MEITYSEICQANYILSLRKYTDLNVMLDIDVRMIYVYIYNVSGASVFR
jgi:hypothetical protein